MNELSQFVLGLMSDNWITYPDIMARVTENGSGTPEQLRSTMGMLVGAGLIVADDSRPYGQRKGPSVRKYRLARREPDIQSPSTLHALQCGAYTINVNGWIFANDRNATLQLTIAALEPTPDKTIVHKKLTFEADEARQVRAWLAAQTGVVVDTKILESERDAAIKLAEEAEARAKRAEEQLTRIKRMIGGAE